MWLLNNKTLPIGQIIGKKWFPLCMILMAYTNTAVVDATFLIFVNVYDDIQHGSVTKSNSSPGVFCFVARSNTFTILLFII